MFKQKARVKKGFLADAREITILILIIVLVRVFGFGLYQVPTGSMETTMLVGERFFADKLSVLFSKPKHTDIISFSDPTFKYSKNPLVQQWQNYVYGPSNWTKRVIGQPGDVIKGVIEDGKPVVYRNGEKLDEPYVNKYPLITLCRIGNLQLRNIMRKEAMRMGAESSQVLFDKVANQTFDKYCNARSYDSKVSFEKQPFYRMNPMRIVRINSKGDLSLDGVGASLLQYPNDACVAQQGNITRRGDSYWSGSDEFYVELGPNDYWLMGDNRRGSFDSRFFGPVDSSLVHGKILYRIWSIDSNESWWILDLIKHPIDFWSRVRWSRFLQRVR